MRFVIHVTPGAPVLRVLRGIKVKTGVVVVYVRPAMVRYNRVKYRICLVVPGHVVVFSVRPSIVRYIRVMHSRVVVRYNQVEAVLVVIRVCLA